MTMTPLLQSRVTAALAGLMLSCWAAMPAVEIPPEGFTVGPEHRRAAIQGLYDWSRAGYRAGRSLPGDGDVATVLAATDFGLVADDDRFDGVALQAAIDRQARPDLSDEEFCDADVAFHRVIVEAAGNPVLDYVMVFALEALHPSTNLVINRFRRRKDVLTLQQDLLDAVERGDPAAAETAIHAQMDHLSEIYDEAQEWVAARRTEREERHDTADA
jgi:hypothetical protein